MRKKMRMRMKMKMKMRMKIKMKNFKKIKQLKMLTLKN